MNDYCHLCDADPCYCGQNGTVAASPSRSATSRSGPRGIDEPMRDFVLSGYESGVHEDWNGWFVRLLEKFGPDRTAVRNAWNRVSNQLGREWRLIAPEGEPMMHPSHYPHMQHLSVPETIVEVERLIASGAWKVGDPGLRMWQVATRLPSVVYISVYDALHELNRRQHLVTTTAPSGKPSQFWYVRAD
ncbi:hypothetical protein [Nocardioides ultimimeridianus]